MSHHHRKFKSLDDYFDMNNASSTIKSIIEKCYKKNPKMKYDNLNKAEIFLQSLDKIRLDEEVKENDYIYILKELQKQAKLNQKMIDLYGTKAKFQNEPKFTFRDKVEKNIFFNPFLQTPKNINNDNYSINSYSNDTNYNNYKKLRGKKINDQIIKLPLIFQDKESQNDENCSKINTSKLYNKSLQLSKNNLKSQRYNTNYKLIYEHSKRGEKGYYSQYLKNLNSYDKKNDSASDKNMSKTLSFKNRNSNIFTKKNYFSKDRDEQFTEKLGEMKTSLVKNRNIQKKYLKAKGYIYDDVKTRYNYINHKFFE